MFGVSTKTWDPDTKSPKKMGNYENNAMIACCGNTTRNLEGSCCNDDSSQRILHIVSYIYILYIYINQLICVYIYIKNILYIYIL